MKALQIPAYWRNMDKELPLSGGLSSSNKGRFAPVKGGSGVPTPARLTRGTNEPTGEIWATGRILLSKTDGFLSSISLSILVMQQRDKLEF